MNKTNIIKIKNCISIANDFYEVGCEYEKKRICGEYQYLSIVVTSFTLACELYMKAILMKNNHYDNSTHNLKVLYDKIKEKDLSISKMIETQYNAEISSKNIFLSLDKFLKKHKNHYKVFRYLYNNINENHEIHFSELGVFVNVLKKYCNNVILDNKESK